MIATPPARGSTGETSGGSVPSIRPDLDERGGPGVRTALRRTANPRVPKRRGLPRTARRLVASGAAGPIAPERRERTSSGSCDLAGRLEHHLRVGRSPTVMARGETPATTNCGAIPVEYGHQRVAGLVRRSARIRVSA